MVFSTLTNNPRDINENVPQSIIPLLLSCVGPAVRGGATVRLEDGKPWDVQTRNLDSSDQAALPHWSMVQSCFPSSDVDVVGKDVWSIERYEWPSACMCVISNSQVQHKIYFTIFHFNSRSVIFWSLSFSPKLYSYIFICIILHSDHN